MQRPAPPLTARVVDSAIDFVPLPLVIGAGSAQLVMWPATGALYRTFHVLDLKPGDRTVDLEHPSDSVYYVMSGAGTVVDNLSAGRQDLVEGSMLHIDAGDSYRFEAPADGGLKLVGGPCPADPRLYAHLLTEAETD